MPAEVEGLVGAEPGREAFDLVRLEVAQKRPAAAVGRTTGQPVAEELVAVDAVSGGEEGLRRQELDGERGAERRDAIAGLRRAGGEEGGAAVGGAGDDLGPAKRACSDRTDRRAGLDHLGQKIASDAESGEPGGPEAGDGVPAELQGVVVVAEPEAAGQPGASQSA